MATWAEFSRGSAQILNTAEHGARGRWEPFEPGAAALAAAGERLLGASPAGIALLATASRTGRPRVHPFMPRLLDGRLCAFILSTSPKLRDLLAGRPCTIHSALAAEDEEFWVSGHAHVLDDAGFLAKALAAMPWARPEFEVLVEFDLDSAGWTTWLDFGTSMHRPQHHRWRDGA